jgi:hypothetical protein
VIIAPDGGDAWAPMKPRSDEALIPGAGTGASEKAVLYGVGAGGDLLVSCVRP